MYHSAVSQVDYVDAALRTFFQIHTDQPIGDVLIFLPGMTDSYAFDNHLLTFVTGQEDIESLEKSVQLYAKRMPSESMGVS